MDVAETQNVDQLWSEVLLQFQSQEGPRPRRDEVDPRREVRGPLDGRLQTRQGSLHLKGNQTFSFYQYTITINIIISF